MTNIIAQKIIESKILFIRGHKVMLDRDLAALYRVETRQLTRQVRRNPERFPSTFLLHLTSEEFTNLKCQIGTSSWGGTRKHPMAFTEHGILMLSSVLNSKRAIQVNIQIMETFTKLRAMLVNHRELKLKIDKMEKNMITNSRLFLTLSKDCSNRLKNLKNVLDFILNLL